MTLPLFEPVDWYDLPRLYDIVYDEGTEDEAAFIEGAFARHAALDGGSGRRVLEPACGSGRLMAALARRGWETAGFDGNPRMLDFARERFAEAGWDGRFWEDRMESFQAVEGSQDLAFCLVSTFKYLLSERHACEHLRRVAAALKPGGLYLLGLHLTPYDRTAEDNEHWEGEREGTRVACDTHTWPANRIRRREKMRTRLVVTEGGTTRRFETHWDFRTYNARQVRSLLAKVPELDRVAAYDFTYNLSDPRQLDDSYEDIVLVLRKSVPGS